MCNTQTKMIDFTAAAAVMNAALLAKGWKRSVTTAGTDWGVKLSGSPGHISLLCPDGQTRNFYGPLSTVSAEFEGQKLRCVVRYG